MKKKFFSLMIVLSMAVGVCLPCTLISAANTDYKQIYIDYFKENQSKMDGKTGFVITELNGDDVPELFAVAHTDSSNISGIVYNSMFSIENGAVKEYATQGKTGTMYSTYLPDVDVDSEDYIEMFVNKFDDSKTLVSFYYNNYTKEDRMAYVSYDGEKVTVYEGEATSADRRAFIETEQPVYSVFISVSEFRLSLEEALNELFAKYNASSKTSDKKEKFTQEKADKSKYKKPEFNDINNNNSYTDYILALGYINLFKGDDKGNFNPDNTITRAEFSAIVCRMLGYENEAEKYKGENVFIDVLSSHWASGYIYVASELGIINGYGGNKFGPEDPVTYEQAIKMLICAIGNDKSHICEARQE